MEKREGAANVPWQLSRAVSGEQSDGAAVVRALACVQCQLHRALVLNLVSISRDATEELVSKSFAGMLFERYHSPGDQKEQKVALRRNASPVKQCYLKSDPKSRNHYGEK